MGLDLLRPPIAFEGQYTSVTRLSGVSTVCGAIPKDAVILGSDAGSPEQPAMILRCWSPPSIACAGFG